METNNGIDMNHQDVDGTVIELAGLDLIWARYYATMFLAFRPRPGFSQADIITALQTSLESTCHKVPIFKGRVFERPADDTRPAAGQLEIRIKHDWIPELVHNDLSHTELDYDELELAGFPPGHFSHDKVPSENLAWSPPSTGAPVVTCQANFFKGGLILGVRVSHALADATGAVFLLKHWAQQTRLLRETSSEGSELSFGAGSYDRSILHNNWVARGRPIADTADASQWRVLGLLPPGNPCEVPQPHPEMEGSIFYVSATSYKALVLAGQQKDKLEETNSSIPSNDVLTAWLWRTSIRARKSCTSSPEQYANDELTCLDMAINARAVLANVSPWDYIANMLMFASPSMTIGDLLHDSMSLAVLSDKIHKSATFMTIEKGLAAYGLATTLHDYKYLPFAFTAIEGTEVFVNNLMAMQVSELSFGDLFLNGGCADIGRPLFLEFGGFCRRIAVLPANGQGGVEIFLEMPAKEIQALQADEEFTRYAQFVC